MNDSLDRDAAAAAATNKASSDHPESRGQTHLNTSVDESFGSVGSEERLVNESMAEASEASNVDSGFVVGGPPTLKETLLCFAFCVIGNGAVITVLLFMDPHERPMPVQYLEGSAEYARRLSNNETYEGETLDTISLLLLCALCPIIIQM